MTPPTPQDDNVSAETDSDAVSPEHKALTKALKGLKLRGIGPAVMGGRIADIAVHPKKSSTWYVAVGSGGLWKTSNAGTTWEAVFEEQPSYSIGCVTIDPNQPDHIWVGTGENVSGRHVAWGDGVYLSRNGGKTWQQMGLEKSEHISRILVDPRNSNVLFVAAEGALWSSGGERGLYKSVDGGESWTAALEIDADTGVTDVLFAPDNPDVLYAASYQRRRHVWAHLAGGPGSGIHKSTDGGETWRQIKEGLPEGDMGKIGLAVTPADPDIVYATIEAGEKERGFYRSQDRGESWERRNEYLSNGTGPHYYQEIEASPLDARRVYQMDVFVHVTREGGKNYEKLETGTAKHCDNHALWIDPQDGDHLLVGTDGGLYESFDEGATWRHFPNMPVSQFYRLAVDNSEPFYNVLGGAQDLGTLFGPSRTTNAEGVRNQDWYVPLGADGYHVAFDPEETETLYLEWQVGNVMRYDRRSEEAQDIKPMPEPGEPPERWNWDTPILISPHNRRRLYVGSQRVWRSDDRGDSWKAVSGDLTHNHNRYELEMFGRVWSVDDLYDNAAMSQYSTISSLTESPVVEGLLIVGTDDGLIQVSEDGGGNWRAAGALPSVPPFSFINDVEASLHEADVLFAVADAHKTGDYSPYVFESRDRGRTWESISGDLPEGTIVWALQQDHVNSDLLFLGTEYGVYFTANRGANWHKLGAGVPTIAFRDIKIQRRENDLVGATFGRGFYVLDDYSPLRTLNEETLSAKGNLFPVRNAWWYVPNQPMQARGQPSLGSTAFKAPNPPFGATFTYYLKEDVLGAKKRRHVEEKALREENKDIPFPGWDRLRDEAVEKEPFALLVVRDAEGQAVREIEGPAEEGLHRLSWDLRRPPPDLVDLEEPAFLSPWQHHPKGPLAAPGHYTVELLLVTSAGLEALGSPQPFEVKPLPTTAPDTDVEAVTRFQQEAGELMRRVIGAENEIEQAEERSKHMRKALKETPRGDASLVTRLNALDVTLAGLKKRLLKDEVRQQRYEASGPSIRERVNRVVWLHWETRQSPTMTQQRNVEIAREEFAGLVQELSTLIASELAQLEADLEAAGAPWTPGRRLQA